MIVNGTAAGAFAKFAKPVRDVSSGKTEKTFKVPSLDDDLLAAAHSPNTLTQMENGRREGDKSNSRGRE